jgi:hypothetical protein
VDRFAAGLGAAKFGELGMRVPLAHVDPPCEDLVARVAGQFRGAGLVAG